MKASCALIIGSLVASEAFRTNVYSLRRSAFRLHSTATSTIRTDPTPVYIEDTDAYGIMYNSNHLRAFDRALIDFSHPVVSMDSLVFKAAPTMGQEYWIEGEEQEDGSWNLELKNGSIVYSIIQGVRVSSNLPSATPLEGANKLATWTFATHRDEYENHLIGRMPLHRVLNLFERSRSNFIGGPAALKRLRDESDIVILVTSMEQLTLLAGDSTHCQPGTRVTVETGFVSKRKGRVLECRHVAKVDGVPVAQGIVNLLLLQESTGRPTNRLPDWLKDMMGIE